jgi:hypothetical protein
MKAVGGQFANRCSFADAKPMRALLKKGLVGDKNNVNLAVTASGLELLSALHDVLRPDMFPRPACGEILMEHRS